MRSDPLQDFHSYEGEREREFEKRQACHLCKKTIADDYCYFIDGDYVCEDCLEEFYQIETPVEEY